MALLPILRYPNPRLHLVAQPVEVVDERIRVLVADMLETMYAADGVGLAAPQIGLPLRLFVALEMEPGADGEEYEDDEELAAAERRRRWDERREHVIVNPVFRVRSGLQHGRDGCLSLPGLSVEDVPRDLSVELEYQDLDGNPHTVSATGYFAHVLQHEYDHLAGKFYFDNLTGKEKTQFLRRHEDALLEIQQQAAERRKTADVPFRIR